MTIHTPNKAENASIQLSTQKYRPDIDGLRAAAALFVIAFHAFPISAHGGFIGVDIFFVISGFLISKSIFTSLDMGSFSFPEFYARRIRRIFPALILVIFSCYAFGWLALLADEYKQLGRHIAAASGFLSNFVLWAESGYFDKSAATKPLLHLWSLGIEEQFYIIWPLAVWMARKTKFQLIIVTVILVTISLYIYFMTARQDLNSAFYLPQARFWEILSGSILSWFTLYGNFMLPFGKSWAGSSISTALYQYHFRLIEQILANLSSSFGVLLLCYGLFQPNDTDIVPLKLAYPVNAHTY